MISLVDLVLDLDLRLMCSYRVVVVGGIDLLLKGFRLYVRERVVNGQVINFLMFCPSATLRSR